MAVDRKYGHVTVEHGDIADDEPVIVFRAQDTLVAELLKKYWNLASAAGCRQEHLDGIVATRQMILDWQATHRTQLPVSAPPAGGGER